MLLNKNCPTVAIVHSVAEMGGAERMSQVILEQLHGVEANMVLITPEVGPFTDWAKLHNVPVKYLTQLQFSASQSIAYIKQTIRWVQYLKEAKIDIVHTADPFCTQAIMPACKIAGVKVLTHFHFPFSEEVIRWAYGRFAPDIAVFCSQELQTSTGSVLAKISPKTLQSVVHNGVKYQSFPPKKRTPNLIEPVIGIVANLQERKGHDDFIDMANILTNANINAQYRVIGGDILAMPRDAILKEKVNTLGLASRFTFTGQVENVSEQLEQLDIYVCASHQEAFPVSILEAMATQQVIVSTNVNGITEALDETCAYLVEPNSPKMLAAQVHKILSQPEEALCRAKRAREKLVNEFSLETYLAKFIQIYRALSTKDSLHVFRLLFSRLFISIGKQED